MSLLFSNQKTQVNGWQRRSTLLDQNFIQRRKLMYYGHTQIPMADTFICLDLLTLPDLLTCKAYRCCVS